MIGLMGQSKTNQPYHGLMGNYSAKRKPRSMRVSVGL